ncbi:MAG: hypothetical protein E7320_07340 [Clostridiales bacterium]|nr:hypothetical protein [Clostridiales bacterium]
MDVLITDPKAGVLLTDLTGCVLGRIEHRFLSPYCPVASAGHLLFACRSARDCLCIHRGAQEERLLLPSLPALGGMCISPCGRYLYQLSTEADCLHTLHLGSGELCYAMPAGVFPRSLTLSRDGRQLLVAGGAVSEAGLYAAPELWPLGTIHTKHPCFAAAFWKGGIVLLCAAEGAELQTILYTLPPGGVRPREKLRLPGQPGGLCVCPDGLTALLSTPDGLMKAELATGKLLWNRPEWPLAMRLEVSGPLALVSDTLCGRICLLEHKEPWKQRILLTGEDAQACFCPKPVHKAAMLCASSR